jgi:hypothetical protein
MNGNRIEFEVKLRENKSVVETFDLIVFTHFDKEPRRNLSRCLNFRERGKKFSHRVEIFSVGIVLQPISSHIPGVAPALHEFRRRLYERTYICSPGAFTDSRFLPGRSVNFLRVDKGLSGNQLDPYDALFDSPTVSQHKFSTRSSNRQS